MTDLLNPAVYQRRVHSVMLATIVIAVYGDVLKWWMSGTLALALIYGLAFVLTIWLVMLPAPHISNPPRQQGLISFGIVIVVAAYVLYGFISIAITNDLARVGVGVAYVTLPFVFVLAARNLTAFADIVKIGNIFLIVMLPIHLVGLVQFFLDPHFFVFHTYSENGGLVHRNFLSHFGGFTRFPSIYASADRYASLSASHAYFALMLLLIPRARTSPVTAAWLASSLIVALVGLLVAGARSRILLVMIVLVTGSIVGILRTREPAGSTSYFRLIPGMIALVTLVVISGAVTGTFPIVKMLSQTWAQGDVQARVAQAVAISGPTHSTSFVGEGIGSLTPDGTPGEFGMRSLWIEMGVAYGSFVLMGFGLVILGLAGATIRAIRSRDPAATTALLYPSLVLAAGLLAGLKFSVEVSTGLVLSIGIVLGLARLRPRLSSFAAGGSPHHATAVANTLT